MALACQRPCMSGLIGHAWAASVFWRGFQRWPLTAGFSGSGLLFDVFAMQCSASECTYRYVFFPMTLKHRGHLSTTDTVAKHCWPTRWCVQVFCLGVKWSTLARRPRLHCWFSRDAAMYGEIGGSHWSIWKIKFKHLCKEMQKLVVVQKGRKEIKENLMSVLRLMSWKLCSFVNNSNFMQSTVRPRPPWPYISLTFCKPGWCMKATQSRMSSPCFPLLLEKQTVTWRGSVNATDNTGKMC